MGMVTDNVRGSKGEEVFYNTMKALGKEVIKVVPGTKEDRLHHIDFWVDGISYDVKAEKKLNAWDKETNPNVIWMEFIGISGYPGWLYGKEQKLSFQSGKELLIVDRDKLRQYAEDNIPVSPVQVGGDKPYKMKYGRRSYKDVMAFVWREDIKHLIEEIIPIINNVK